MTICIRTVKAGYAGGDTHVCPLSDIYALSSACMVPVTWAAPSYFTERTDICRLTGYCVDVVSRREKFGPEDALGASTSDALIATSQTASRFVEAKPTALPQGGAPQ